MGYPGRGINNQILTFDANRIRWKNAIGFGVGVTVGAVGEASYATITSAIAASHNILHVIGPVVESTFVNIPSSGLYITMYHGADVNMGTGVFRWNNGVDFAIGGNGSITFGYTTTTTLFNANGTTGKLILDNVDLINNSSGSGVLFNGTDCRISRNIVSGNLLLDGTRNGVLGTTVLGNVIFMPTSVDCRVENTNVDGSITDFGSGTLMSEVSLF